MSERSALAVRSKGAIGAAGAPLQVLVQASLRSWSGGADLCSIEVEGAPVLFWTVKRALESLPSAEVVVTAPADDQRDTLGSIIGRMASDRVRIVTGFESSPLERMLKAYQELSDEDRFIRIDGLHFCVDLEASVRMLGIARAGDLDCMKLPDDFPVHFTSDIYRVGALREVLSSLRGPEDDIFRVHPKFYMYSNPNRFHCRYLDPPPSYSPEHLQACRRRAEPVYSVPREAVTENRIWSGDTLGFHYEIAADHLGPNMDVLEVACGDGWGARLLGRVVRSVVGADLDPEVIEIARKTTAMSNVQYSVQDVVRMDFPDAHFDAVTSMETLEHLDGLAYMREVHRVLKPGGVLILSTPQNRLGHIPVNSAHVHEYSLDELLALCQTRFEVERVIGIKAGRVVVPDDPLGTNTVVICRRAKHG